MSALNISKVAVGCTTLDALRRRQQSCISGGVVPVLTRFRPKRADELVGGSLYWIIKHRIAARQTILGFSEDAERRTLIHLDPILVPVRALPKRAHQGWRYLAAADAPQDFEGGEGGIEAMPAELIGKLSSLALI